MKYVVLLRGVNVGGNHPVPKAEFQAVLEELGFRDVVIYINSGNAVFVSETAPVAVDVQKALEAHFGFDIPTLVLPAEKIKAIAVAIPTGWSNDPVRPDKTGQKSDVLYLFDEVNNPDILQQLSARPEIEEVMYVDGAILTNIAREYQSRSCLLKLMGMPLYKQVTIRNITTAKKLAELVS